VYSRVPVARRDDLDREVGRTGPVALYFSDSCDVLGGHPCCVRRAHRIRTAGDDEAGFSTDHRSAEVLIANVSVKRRGGLDRDPPMLEESRFHDP